MCYLHGFLCHHLRLDICVQDPRLQTWVLVRQVDTLGSGLCYRLSQHTVLLTCTSCRRCDRVHLPHQGRLERQVWRYTAYCHRQWFRIGRRRDECCVVGTANVWRRRGELLGVRLWDVRRVSSLSAMRDNLDCRCLVMAPLLYTYLTYSTYLMGLSFRPRHPYSPINVAKAPHTIGKLSKDYDNYIRLVTPIYHRRPRRLEQSAVASL